MQMTGRKVWSLTSLVLVAALSACTTTVNRAPVEDRGRTGSRPVMPSPEAANAGKPGYYVVQQGDTIMKIAAAANQPWREIVRWNELSDPNAIEVGRVLRIAPPPNDTGAPEVTAPKATAAAVPMATQTTPGVPAAPASAAEAPSEPPPAPSAPPAPPSAGADDVAFIWPASGAVVDGFDEANHKGISIAGKAGDPVLAAADGRVVYAGAGLRGYGNLVILKHNNTFLTAYAHNQKLLVKEDQAVKKGQKIAEMGSTDADRVQLHFEIRRSGKPVDPTRYLSSR